MIKFINVNSNKFDYNNDVNIKANYIRNKFTFVNTSCTLANMNIILLKFTIVNCNHFGFNSDVYIKANYNKKQ